jgi:hypothetical protein
MGVVLEKTPPWVHTGPVISPTPAQQYRPKVWLTVRYGQPRGGRNVRERDGR